MGARRTSRVGKPTFGPRRLWLAVLGLSFLCGCAQLPAETKIKAFADAAATTSDTLKLAIDLNTSLAQQQGDDRDAKQYLRGGGFDIPPKPTPALARQNTALRLKLITAIERYAKSLAGAADQGTMQDLRDAATSLATSVGEEISLFVPVSIPIVTPVAKLVGWAVGASVTNAQAVEIQEVIQKTHPILVRAAAELKTSLAIIVNDDRTQLANWKIQKFDLLDQVRDGASTALGEFRTAANQAREYETRVTAASKYAALLDGMVKAHAALLNSGDEADLKNFVSLAKDVSAVISASKSGP